MSISRNVNSRWVPRVPSVPSACQRFLRRQLHPHRDCPRGREHCQSTRLCRRPRSTRGSHPCAAYILPPFYAESGPSSKWPTRSPSQSRLVGSHAGVTLTLVAFITALTYTHLNIVCSLGPLCRVVFAELKKMYNADLSLVV